MAENKNKLKIRIKAGILISVAFLSGSVKFLSVNASEFGGFDVSTGTGAFDTDWSDWDNEPAYEAPAKDNNDTEEVCGNGQVSEENIADSTTADIREDDSTMSGDWNEQTNAGTGEVGNSFYDQRYMDESVSQSNDNRSTNRNETLNNDAAEAAYSEIPEPTLLPADTPTPVSTPTAEPTVTPAPAFTEVPREEVSTVTEYEEAYKLPPAECLKKMKLFYWNKELSGGKYAEIQINKEMVQQIISVRINGQEIDWQTKTKSGITTIKVLGLSEKRNHMELAVMVPADLAWTRNEKNVILTYNVFEHTGFGNILESENTKEMLFTGNRRNYV